jgi:hypothetical protein
MLFLLFAFVLQTGVLLELCLNRIVGIFLNTRRSSSRTLVDANFVSQIVNLLVSILLLPITWIGVCVQVLISQFFLLLSLLVVVGVLAVVNQSSSNLLTLLVNVYNAGFGEMMNDIVIAFLELFAPFFRVLLPIWNSIIFMGTVFIRNVFLPFIFVNTNTIPDLILNLTTMVSTLAISLAGYVTSLLECVQYFPAAQNSTSPFWVNDMTCIATPYTLSLDLMTPAIFAQRTATNIRTMFISSCGPATNVLTILFYPLIDYNFYKMVHGAVNLVLHVFFTLPVWTANRCEYAERSIEYEYTALEKKIMCIPDISHTFSILTGTLRAFGSFVDNLLDMSFAIVYSAVSGRQLDDCGDVSLQTVWQDASEVFGTRKLQVVGMTRSLYAITDGDSAMYHSMSGSNTRSSYALHTWPFQINTDFGVAAVRYSEANDYDDEGEDRTGLLGCQCQDTTDGLMIVCASVPYQKHLAEDDADNAAFTTHRVRFLPDSARDGLTCSNIVVRVSSLRFSRKRFSSPSPAVGGESSERSFIDPYRLTQVNGDRQATSRTADAAIIVMPLCAVRDSVTCIPTLANCFPFCLALHAAGQSTQTLSMHNAQSFTEWTSIGQTDCVVSEAEKAVCSNQERMAVNDENDVAIGGCGGTQCSPDADTVTFLKNAALGTYNRSISSWNSQQSLTYVRSEQQPFVFAGDMFLYSEEQDPEARSGVIRTTRLYDNKRGDFSMQQEELSLTPTSLELQYAECDSEECYTTRLNENKIVLPLQVTSRPVYVSAVSEWAVHWVSTPDLVNCAIFFEVCSGRAAGGISVEDELARLWSVYTVRSTNDLGEVFTESRMTSYMVIPQFFKCSQGNQCNSVVNMKVTGLEYMNEENLLLTVLATSAENWDWRTNDVIEGREFEYRYYFVHPNRHDCTTDGSNEARFTCWREESEGMFRSTELSLSAMGSLCPAMQRMPKWGSMLSESGIAAASLLEVLLETVFMLPASLTVPGGLNEVFQVRDRPTFHRFLDMRGSSLLDLDPCFRAAEQAAFHLANTMVRAAKIFEGRPGGEVIEPVLLGTARVFQYTTGLSMVENRVLGPLASSFVFDKFLNKLSQNTQSAPVTPFASKSPASGNLLQMFSTMFSGATSWAKVTMKAVKKMALKILMKQTTRAASTGVMTVAYELKGDMRRGVFDAMRFVCDGFGQIIGRTNAWGQLARHSCLIGPDSIESTLEVLFIITLEYPVMDCVCKQVAGLQTEEAIEKICMTHEMSMKQKSFTMQTARDANEQQESQCFRVMDATNDRLLKAMDPALSRMYKAMMALQNAFASILGGSGSTSCSDWEASPFVISLLPEPVDYFMGCMHTIDCRSRCLDPLLAFEEALSDYRDTNGQDLALSKSFEIETESRFFNANEEFEGKHLAPFVIYAVMPLQDSVCPAICTGLARCVVIAGMDATGEQQGQGHLQTGYYCVPVSVVESVYKADARMNTSEYGSFGTGVVTNMHIASRHKAIVGEGEWLVIVTRSIDTGLSTVLMLPGASDVALELFRTRSFEIDSYSDTEDVNDRRWSAQSVNRLFVLPAHANHSWSTIFMSLSQTTPTGFLEKVCVYTFVDTAADGVLYDNVLYPCTRDHDVIFPPNHHIICIDVDCKRAVRLPHGPAELELVQYEGYQPAEGAGAPVFDWKMHILQTSAVSSQQRSVVRAYNAEILTLTQNNKVQLTRRQLSSVGYVTRNSSDEVYVDVSLTGRGEAMEAWLQNVRIVIPKDNAVTVAVSTSFETSQNVQLVVNCSVSSCVGCQGSGPREVDIQHKCFAAATCAVGRCVGSTVNMNRPLCQIGAMLGTQADEYRILLAAFWTFFANNVIFVVELSANRRKKYEISWPAEIKQMFTCQMKDVIIQFWSMFGAILVNVITAGARYKSKNDMAQSYADTTMQLSSEARTQAMTTISTTAFVELMVHMNMGVVYAPIVVWKVMQCKMDSAFGVLSTGSDTTFKLGSSEFDKVHEAAVGVCIGEKIKQALADMSDGKTNKALKSDISSLISNLSSMITGQMIGNFAFMYDAFFAWAGGVCTGLMNLVQVLDWTRCKLPVIDNAVVSSCVCGDRPARIPNAQRQSMQTTDSLWCYGPLMLSDTEGKDQLIWNPYSLQELLQLRNEGENLQQYLDCISMNRCNFESLIPSSVGSIEDYVSCMNSNALYEPSCERFAAYTACVNEKVDCNTLKPTNAVFEAQGVELMQVITRCRTNYQQKRWDQAAPLLGMLDVATWTTDPASAVKTMAYNSESDSLSKERKRMSMLGQFMKPFTALDEGTWSCLNASLESSQFSNNCADLGLANNIFPDATSLLTYFEYEIKDAESSFENMDACESFSGRVSDRNQDNVVYPKIVWDGDSANAVPVAELHYTKMYDKAWRMSIAERELDNLITFDIKPLFRMLTTKALEEIATTYWSFDGDFVHQLVDCVMLGPFAAADMMPSFRTTSGRVFQVPQYHRGNADSRQIQFANKTSGSDIRQQIMRRVIEHIGKVKDDIIMKHVTAALSELQDAYSNKMNLYCRCFDGRKSLECCLVSHEDLSTFTRTFAAQYVLQKVEDLKEEIEGSLASSIFSTTILTEDIWANESFTYTHEFQEMDRVALGEAYFFDYSKPVYHYTPSEVVMRLQDTVWTQCTRALRAAFYTLPLLQRGDDVLEVDTDTIFDPNEFVQGGGERYMHATERVIERILEKAKTYSPVFWSHVHRYMPSDSVWCEGTDASSTTEPETAHVPREWHDMVFTQESIEAPDAGEVLYVAHVTKACPCAWKNGSMCVVPPDVCNSVYAVQDTNRWNALCETGTYNSSSDIMFVRSVLENAAVSLPFCREYLPSTVWGLLDSTQHYTWYNGQSEKWNVSLHEVATLGPGGIRLSDLLASSPRDFDAEMLLRIQRHKDHSIWNSQFEHTIAQPVCNGTHKDYLRQNLSEYFMDILFPMAHSVYEAPSQAICGRWVTEYALYALLSNVSGPADPHVEKQRLTEEIWRRRCLLQLEQIGICNLRGVFHIAPSTHKSYAHCPFAVPQHDCHLFYVTDDCLVMCDGTVYDPCMCTDVPDCNSSFSPDTCPTGVILMPPSSSFDLASLHWPRLAWPDKNTQELLDHVYANQSVHGIPFVLDDEMIEYVLAQANKEEGGTPDAFCDDTLDYLHRDARHPVGYHPTCACTRERTNMRGFTSWMSSGDDYAWSIDPTRVRNMTQFSSVFGSSHLVCDAAVYGVGYEMNNLQMQSKWNPNARADPAVPIPPDFVSETSMFAIGTTSGDAWDTAHVPAREADAMFKHSVGIVRDWLRYHSDEDEAHEIQMALDEIWPHWTDSGDTYGAHPNKPMESGCSFPSLFMCVRDSDCGESLTCKYYDVDDSPLGICAHRDTCFRHDHCDEDRLCSGEGLCVKPEIVIRNTLDVEIDAHVFAKKATQCSRSSFGMSKEQNIPSFAQDNGLCGVRNYFTYKNITYDVRASTENEKTVFDIPDKITLRTAQTEDGLLTDENDGFLRMKASPCDRNYEHTDYGICIPCPVNQICTGMTDCVCTDSNYQPVQGINTWERTSAGGVDVRFCNVASTDGDLANLVSPYVHIDSQELIPVDTLKQSRLDIQRCLDFDICPTSSFTVRGQAVAQRIVLLQTTVRAYALQDTKLCFAFGLWDADTELCSLDRLAVPLFEAIYKDASTSTSLENLFTDLRQNCETAFGTDYDTAINEFETVYNDLRAPYAPSSSADIQNTVNTLLLKVFNLRPTSMRDRGIESMHQYKQKAKCLRYMYDRLQVVRNNNAEKLAVYTVAPEEIPGSTLYLFHPHAPLEVPLLWFWKCVIVAKETEGGAPLQWLAMMTKELDSTVPCENVDTNSTQTSTLRRHLQLQPDIYISSVTARTNIDIFSDMLIALEMAFAFWNIDPLPSINCFVTPSDEHDDWCNTSQYSNGKDCTRVFAPPISDVPDSKYALNSMFDLALQFLFKKTRSELEEMNALTLQNLLDWNLAEERNLTSNLAESTDYSNAIPVYELTALSRDLEDLLVSQDPTVFRLQNTRVVNCLPDEALEFPEYQIATSVCISSRPGEIPLPNDKLRVQMYNRIFSIINTKTSDPEILKCFDTNEPQDKYSAISQKQALLLMMHYLKYVIHSTKDSKFGMLTYDEDVRWYMQRDVALTREVADITAKASRYQMHIVAKNFICSETETFPDPVPESPLQANLRNCLADLKREIGWRVSKRDSLVLQPARDVLLGGFYASFAVSSTEDPFVDSLVNTDWQKAKHVFTRNELCFKTLTGAAYLRPLWTGNLDLQSCPFGESCGCETSRDGPVSFFDISCDKSSSMESCKAEFPTFYTTVTTAMYEDCHTKQNKPVSIAQYEQMKTGNLCLQMPKEASDCPRDFGAQGRMRGRAMSDLHIQETVKQVQSGLFDTDSTIFQGMQSATENLTATRILGTDIGGNSIGFSVYALGRRDSGSQQIVLDITCVSAGRSCRDPQIRKWLSQAPQAWRTQHLRFLARSIPASQESTHWSCPLQWLSMYGDNRTLYAARTPNAYRNRARFQHLTGDSYYAHVTVSSALKVAQHPARFMSDASACVDGTLQGSTVSYACKGRPLLLAATQLHRRGWSTVAFHTSSGSCTRVLDWPHRAFKTADGLNGGDAETAPEYCNVFDRLPSFAVRYVTVELDKIQKRMLLPSTAPGGVCHMGRLKRLPKNGTSDSVQFCTAFPAHSRCRMLSVVNQSDATLQVSSYETDIPVQDSYVARKNTTRPVRHCKFCEEHTRASFVDRFQRHRTLEHGPVQLSVGLPIRLSTERVLAAEIRTRLCPGSKHVCDKMHALLQQNRQVWQKGRLMPHLMTMAQEHHHASAPVVRDEELWTKPWVFCKNQPDRCYGVIDKATWQDPTTRFDACKAIIATHSQQNSTPTRFCTLSPQLANLCVKLARWSNEDIPFILCKAAGHPDCLTQSFFYNPTAFSISNKDFVYNSVRAMYTKLDAAACPAIAANRQVLQNEVVRSQCGSVALEPIRNMLTIARSFGFDFSVLQYCIVSFGMNMFGVILGAFANMKYLISESAYNMKVFATLFLNKLGSIMGILWKVIFQIADYDAFAWIKEIVKIFCWILENVIAPVVKGFLKPIFEFLLNVFKELQKGLPFMGWIFNPIIEILTFAVDTMKDFRDTCPADGGSDDDFRSPGTLPVATKCWSTYQTFFGDNNVLSCTKADTCHRSVTDTSLVMCGACPNPTTDFAPFGCLSVTKTCTCSVPVFTMQYCESNSDCYAEDSSCKYLDGELEPSIGFTRCSSCQHKRLCFVGAGASVGYCACTLSDVQWGRCLDQGAPVNPGYDNMCVLTTDYNALQSTFVFSFDESLSTACRLLNQGFTFCSRESGNGFLYVTGNEMGARRRLLEFTPNENSAVAIDTMSSLCRDALISDLMPNVRRDCIDAYEDSRVTVRMLGMQDAWPACAFCGPEDMIHNFMFKPHNMIILFSNVSAVARVFMRHTYARHVMKACKTWQTMLTVIAHDFKDTKDFNDTHTFYLRVMNFSLAYSLDSNESDLVNYYTSQRKLLTTQDGVADAIARANVLHKSFIQQASVYLSFTFETSGQQSEWMSTWPPRVSTQELSDNTCTPAVNVIKALGWSFGNLTASYAADVRQEVFSSINAAWLVVAANIDTGIPWDAVADKYDVVTRTALWLFDYLLSLVGWHRRDIYNVIAAAIAEIPHVVKCDIKAVQTCYKWKKHALHVTVILFVYFVAVYVVSLALGLGAPAILLLTLFPYTVMYVTYGYSPFCSPMVPVCIYDDFLWTARLLLPVHAELPLVMYKNISCAPVRSAQINPDCVRTCEDEIFGYDTWYTVLAWWSVEFNIQDFLLRFVNGIPRVIVSEDDYDALTAQVALKARALLDADEGLVLVNRVCASLGLYMILPYLFIFLSSVYIACSLLQTVVLLVSAVVNVIVALFMSCLF